MRIIRINGYKKVIYIYIYIYIYMCVCVCLVLELVCYSSNFEPPTKNVKDNFNCEELAAGSAYVQPPVPPTSGPGPQQELDWYVFICV